MRHNQKEIRSDTSKKKKKGFLLLVIVVVMAIGLFAVMVVLKPFGNLEPKTFEVDGVVLTGGDSPENALLLDNSSSGPDGWKLYPDTETEKKALDKQIEALIKAFDKKNAKQASTFFTDDAQKMYRDIFEANEASMAAFSEAFSSLDMIFLSTPSSSIGNHYERLAEFQGIRNGIEFSVVFIKVDGKWKVLHL